MIRFFITLLICLSLFISPVIAEENINIPTEAQLQAGEEIARQAIEATEKGDFILAEKFWTELINEFPSNPAVWSNRGNARVSQNKIAEAIGDYNESIKLAPDAPDPYLNRGVAYEGLGKYQDAIADYQKVLELDPEDAMAYNNLGNANAGLENWDEAVKYYHKATELAPNFAFASANESLALYQLGRKQEALTKMRNIVRKYPMFPDMRAALTAVLWEEGKQGEAESNWVATVGMDSRYKNVEWLKEVRRWPPKMIVALENFLTLDN
ncbi:tetratricopeptide repeat protein [Cyanobacterium aponinum AL20118]|uniref:Tetratricopeptide repeat protein n=1 Tax=Cyanobacterium aponinum AL20115 TaxID=3090662 RepID=A0AAF0ZAN4_9CHRO|nr:tetratricopeptide repeat protein [Cyanobacterium aponinum]WPF89521.1 tetratricopeptide repeat protein [Cyanobacterium aponinum AL20115]